MSMQNSQWVNIAALIPASSFSSVGARPLVAALGTNARRGSKAGVGEVDVPLTFGGVTFTPGQRVVADHDGVVVLPAEYARDHVRLGYAATEPGNQSDTQDRSITLATGATTGRGLYVGMTRGRQANHVLVVTDTNDLDAARELLERVITWDRADVPAVARRNWLADPGLDPASIGGVDI